MRVCGSSDKPLFQEAMGGFHLDYLAHFACFGCFRISRQFPENMGKWDSSLIRKDSDLKVDA